MANDKKYSQQFSGRTTVRREQETVSDCPFLNEVIHALATKYSAWLFENEMKKGGNNA